MANEHETHPTPVSGMPAAVAATSVARPSTEIPDATETLLRAIEEVRDEARDRDKRMAERIVQLEATTNIHGGALKRLTDEVTTHGKHLAELTEQQISVSRSAAMAAELAATALSKINSAHDETTKMVTSAMAIQKDAIAAAVVEAIAPVAAKVAGLEASNTTLTANDNAQNKALAEIGVGMRTLIRLANSKRVAAYVMAGAFVGGAVMAIAQGVMK